MSLHDPSPPEQRPASSHDGRSEIGARSSDLTEAAMHFGETVLDDFFCLGVVADERVREAHHADILGLEQVLDRLGDSLLHGHSSHCLHHPQRRRPMSKCCRRCKISRPYVADGHRRPQTLIAGASRCPRLGPERPPAQRAHRRETARSGGPGPALRQIIWCSNYRLSVVSFTWDQATARRRFGSPGGSTIRPH